MFTTGARVHVSSGGPRGWTGTVLRVQPGVLTVQTPNGGRELVHLHMRQVTPLNG